MATSVNLSFDIGQTVWHVDVVKQTVIKAVVKTTDAKLIPGVTTKTYSIQYSPSTFGSKDVVEGTLFPDVDSALAALKLAINV